MRVNYRIACLGAMVAGLAATGAEPAPSPPQVADAAAEAALEQFFPTPRLYNAEVTMQATSASHQTMQMCVGKEFMRQFLAASRALPKTAAAWPQGCSHRMDRTPDGAGHMETACDKVAGASQTFRMTVDSTAGLREAREHMESVLEMGDGPKTFSMDIRMTQAGECPADLQKPGTIRMTDGTVFDGGALMTGLLRPSPSTAPATK